jgi:uncharacterized phiE125 gp8 family phage protein
MSLILLSGPAVEPITLAEAKAHLRVDGTTEDALIASLIITSRLHIEAALGLALISQSWALRLDAWPKGGIVIVPIRPVQSVQSVRVTNADDTLTTIEPTRYLLDGASLPPRLLPTASPLPDPGVRAQGIEIAFTAGYGASAASVPHPIRQAILLLVAHWFECRTPVFVGHSATRLPDIVSALLAPYRMPRL